MVGEASLLHMSGPDIQQLFAQAVGVGDDVGVAVGFAVVGVAVGFAVVGDDVGIAVGFSVVGIAVGFSVVGVVVGLFVLHRDWQVAIYEGVPPF